MVAERCPELAKKYNVESTLTLSSKPVHKRGNSAAPPRSRSQSRGRSISRSNRASSARTTSSRRSSNKSQASSKPKPKTKTKSRSQSASAASNGSRASKGKGKGKKNKKGKGKGKGKDKDREEAEEVIEKMNIEAYRHYMQEQAKKHGLRFQYNALKAKPSYMVETTALNAQDYKNSWYNCMDEYGDRAAHPKVSKNSSWIEVGTDSDDDDL
eukprot:TRINITY_DN16887_c0_g1_i2.p1 TRINITY_DN16887_c0_g1~~TRINITY_DN16887_c0_g1_i2.p1  ORF type:complete len:231 (-),score=62.56 TRINITY_DN16887_c0_g1_i2:87-722(-)